jgi:hypothetical protein
MILFILIFNFIISFGGLFLIKKEKIIKYSRVLQYANIVQIILCLFIILLLFGFFSIVNDRVSAIFLFLIYAILSITILIFNLVILLLNHFSKRKLE